jgi:hypothetical protein
MTQRKSVAMKVVQDSVKPLPKWVGVAGLVLVALSAIGHNQLVVTFGGGRVGEWVANAVPVFAAILSTLAHSLGGKGGTDA